MATKIESTCSGATARLLPPHFFPPGPQCFFPGAQYSARLELESEDLVSGLPPPTFVTVVVVLVMSSLAVVVVLMIPSGLGVSVTVTEGPVVTVCTSRGGERERGGPSERSSK